METKATKFKDLVVEHAKEEIRKRKEERDKHFKEELYNKTHHYTFPPKDKVNMISHRFLPKLNYFTEGKMTMTALAIYPVLCSCADFNKNKWFQCSQENIAMMAGISVNTVVKGIEALRHIKLQFKGGNKKPLLVKEKTKGERHIHRYKVEFVRMQETDNPKGTFFIFHTAIIESGVWAKLTPRAKALYLAMRSTAKFDREAYYLTEYPDMALAPEEEEDGVGSNDDCRIRQQYRDRKWDVCDLSMSELTQRVGISPANIQKSVKQLEHYKLIERMGQSIIVYLKPKTAYII